MPNQRKSRPVRRSSGSGDVFVPVIIILVGITILCLLIAFAWQKWQDKYDPDSRPTTSQSESSSEPEPSSEESSSEPEAPVAQFGQPLPEGDRVTSAYFNDAVFIGDSLTTGIQLYNILPDTTVLVWAWRTSTPRRSSGRPAVSRPFWQRRMPSSPPRSM